MHEGEGDLPATRPHARGVALAPVMPGPGRCYAFVCEPDRSYVAELSRTAAVDIGRAPVDGIVLRDESVSRTHARLVLDDAQAAVEDLGSQNGTWVNGVRVVGRRSLQPGDVIALGAT